MPRRSAQLDVLANDLPGDFGPLNVTDVSAPARGTATVVGGKRIDYESGAAACAGTQSSVTDAFTYSVAAGRLTDTARVEVTITCPPGTGEPEPAGVRVGFNNNAVNDRVASAQDAAKLLDAAGADIDRVQINWKYLEPSPGDYRFATYDAIYEADLARGIRPLFIFAFAPAWASSPICLGLTSCHAPPTPEHYDDAARTAAVIAERYPEAAGIEVWNEPNTPYFWRPAPDPVAYTELLRQIHDAIKAVDPSMPVAGGSTASGVGGSPGKIRASHFLAWMYESGAASEMDAISMHAYPDPGPQAAVAHVDAVRATRDEYGDTNKPIWVTEAGATTTGAEAVTEQEQAELLSEVDALLRSEKDVEMVLFHTLVEPPRGASSSETGYGLIEADMRRKPGFCALAGAWGAAAAC